MPPTGRSTSFVILGLFARANVWASATAGSAVAAATMLWLTLALVVQGAPPGMPVGPHLVAISQIFPGYSVTWVGAVVGAAYSAVVGAIAGFMLALLWNLAHIIVIGASVMNADWLEKQ